MEWLPPGKTAAICFSVDDIHPGTSTDAYEAGGDLAGGVLGRLGGLLDAHDRLRVTLFVTPDWRLRELREPRLGRSMAFRIPYVRDRVHWLRLHPAGQMRLDRHPGFVRFLNGLSRTEVALHGLHHAHVGPDYAVEFQDQSPDEMAEMVSDGVRVFQDSGLEFVLGFAPPAWHLPDALERALNINEFRFVASARDLDTPVASKARCAGSGRRGVALARPELLDRGLIHFPTNFQATSSFRRAFEIIEDGGLLSIKAHAFKDGRGHIMLDGLDELYCNYLDLLFTQLDHRYGQTLWWTSMGEITDRILETVSSGAVSALHAPTGV